MHREGHIGASLVVYAPLSFVFGALGVGDLAFYTAIMVGGLSMLPDIDMRLPIKHRGVTHTVHFAVAVAVTLGILGFAIGLAGPVFFAVLLGLYGFSIGFIVVGSHIAADALTPMGVDPWMNGSRVSFDVTRAASPVANYALLVMGIVTAGSLGMVGIVINGRLT